MNLSQNKKVLLIPFALIFVLGIVFISEKQAYNETHELLHLKIAQNHGCVNWSINHNLQVNNFQCHNYSKGYNHNQEMMLHTLNEIVSYNTSSLCTTMIIITTILIITLFACTLLLKS